MNKIGMDKYNKKISQELKSKGKHRIGDCYRNAFYAAMFCDLKSYYIGYVVYKNNILAIRHAFCINEKGEIIDTTFGDKKKYIADIDYYVIAYKVDLADMCSLMLEFTTDLIGYKIEEERAVINELYKAKLYCAGLDV